MQVQRGLNFTLYSTAICGLQKQARNKIIWTHLAGALSQLAKYKKLRSLKPWLSHGPQTSVNIRETFFYSF